MRGVSDDSDDFDLSELQDILSNETKEKKPEERVNMNISQNSNGSAYMNYLKQQKQPFKKNVPQTVVQRQPMQQQQTFVDDDSYSDIDINLDNLID